MPTATGSAPVPLKRRIFNPHRLGDEDLERSFIARQQTLHDLVRDVSEETPGSHPQHHLVCGQRGMGKTTLLCRLAVELRRDPLCQRFIPLVFPEDQYVEVDRLSKFWLNCLDALADALEREGGQTAEASWIDETVREIERHSMDEKAREAQAREVFTAATSRVGRRPVLLIDQFNLLLARLRDDDFKLRGFFSTADAPVIVASSVTVPDDLQDYGAAFYDGFRTRVLRPLSLEELREVIVRLAREAGNEGLIARLPAEAPRLATLRDLTGGNLRTAVLLFELFSQGFSEDAYEDLEGLLDTITPLYQSRLAQLSDQAQVIVGALARHWRPATAATLCELTRIPGSSVSPQLGRLEGLGLVEKTAVFPPKRTGYQIAERFFSIWYLMRFSTRRQRAGLACLTRFLQELHTPAQLEPGTSRPPFLVRDSLDQRVWADRFVTGPYNSRTSADTPALCEALAAAHEENWGLAANALRQALGESGFRLPPDTRDDWLRASAVLLHLGYGGKLVPLLEAEGADVQMLPWFAAVSAHARGDRRYLLNVPAEARPAAERIFDEIQLRRDRLP